MGGIVRTPTFQPTKMLRHARMVAMTGHTAASTTTGGCLLWAVCDDGPFRNKVRRLIHSSDYFLVQCRVTICILHLCFPRGKPNCAQVACSFIDLSGADPAQERSTIFLGTLLANGLIPSADATTILSGRMANFRSLPPPL